jgi:hypothetical protein
MPGTTGSRRARDIENSNAATVGGINVPPVLLSQTSELQDRPALVRLERVADQSRHLLRHGPALPARAGLQLPVQRIGKVLE